MSEHKIEKTNSDRMVEKNRADVPQPVRAGTGPESMTYQQRTGVYVENDPANKPAGTPDVPRKVPDQPAYEKNTALASDKPVAEK
ncbi:hypothetical protein [Oxalicibacterium faecigallinarum]|uniref:Uncharacterized protein n=1 Tax=Oxalicibacterium faecigallinarum TaxID=573741 RepID=A0A8J3ATK2_9BURK|nr:hypothetical protein [Oxalicibacterium faecigallinarum]GGI18360.1 hypothetical protein GCM10008066_13620 [Oxalicibacterium faecigallinarum]